MVFICVWVFGLNVWFWACTHVEVVVWVRVYTCMGCNINGRVVQLVVWFWTAAMLFSSFFSIDEEELKINFRA